MGIKFNKNLMVIAVVIVATGLIIAGAFLYKCRGEEGLTPQAAAEKAINYINQNLLQEGFTASLVSVAEENGVYKFHLKVGENEFDSYVTKDGKLLFVNPPVDLEEKPISQAPEDEASQPPSEDTISPEELTKFINCLKEANFVIYGANWCGWTKKLVEMLGGWDMVKSIYVECTEKTEICEEKGIKGYPTILIGGEQYQGARTFEEFSVATGCQRPVGTETLNPESPAGECQ